VRARGFAPTTVANVSLGVSGFIKAALGFRFEAVFFAGLAALVVDLVFVGFFADAFFVAFAIWIPLR
jgi:hypothetical protein